MELPISVPGKASSGAVEVAEQVFARDFNEGLVHQVVTAYLAKARQGTHAQKNRSAVSGGGAKPWRQKGTGRARAGTIRSPIWRGGGKTFAATNRDYSKKLNKKMYRVAMQSILSELVRQERLTIVDNLSITEPKTKLLAEQLNKLSLENTLIVTDGFDVNLFLAARNLKNIDIVEAEHVSPLGLVSYENILITVGAVKQLEERLG